MMRSLYAAATSIALPAVAAGVSLAPKYRPLLGRLNPKVPDLAARPIWIHACSVGEVRAAAPLLAALHQRWPHVPRVLTTSTVNGRILADEMFSDVSVMWLPFDHPYLVRRFVRQLRPLVLGLIETELWPALVWETTRRHVPVVLLNGRLSDRHYARNARHPRFMKSIVSKLTAACVQNQLYADRVVSLGLAPDRVTIAGNTKFTSARTDSDSRKLERLRRETGLSPDDPVVVFGSSRPGEEERAAACWTNLRAEFPTLKFVIAPRHPERAKKIAPLFEEPMYRRSDFEKGIAVNEERLLLLDTVGELGDFYALATVAVVGGSFAGGIGGHNPIEPAALGVPTVFGPDMSNFADPAAILVEGRGALQVPGGELCATLRHLLSSPEARRRMGEEARGIVQKNQGAVRLNVEAMANAIDPSALAA